MGKETDSTDKPPEPRKRKFWLLFPVKGEDGVVRLGMVEIGKKDESKENRSQLPGENTVPKDPKV